MSRVLLNVGKQLQRQLYRKNGSINHENLSILTKSASINAVNGTLDRNCKCYNTHTKQQQISIFSNIIVYNLNHSVLVHINISLDDCMWCKLSVLFVAYRLRQ